MTTKISIILATIFVACSMHGPPSVPPHAYWSEANWIETQFFSGTLLLPLSSESEIQVLPINASTYKEGARVYVAAMNNSKFLETLHTPEHENFFDFFLFEPTPLKDHDYSALVSSICLSTSDGGGRLDHVYKNESANYTLLAFSKHCYGLRKMALIYNNRFHLIQVGQDTVNYELLWSVLSHAKFNDVVFLAHASESPYAQSFHYRKIGDLDLFLKLPETAVVAGSKAVGVDSMSNSGFLMSSFEQKKKYFGFIVEMSDLSNESTENYLENFCKSGHTIHRRFFQTNIDLVRFTTNCHRQIFYLLNNMTNAYFFEASQDTFDFETLWYVLTSAKFSDQQ